MQIIKCLCIILISVVISSCHTDIDSIQGHWHSTNIYDDGRYATLDIMDSIAFFNYNVGNRDYEYSKLKYLDGNLTIEIGIVNYVGLVELKGDTLYIGENNDIDKITKYVRFDKNSLYCIKDFNCNSHLNIELPVDNKSVPFDSTMVYNGWAIVNIGYPRTKESKSFGNDTLLLEIKDRIKEFIDISEYLLSDCQTYDESICKDSTIKISLIINAHKDIPQAYLDSIDFYSKNYYWLYDVYRTYVNVDKRLIGLIKIR